MSFTILLAISLSLLIGVSLGLLGGGGSILTVPIMIYALGVGEKSAIASSLLVVGATSAVAVIAHARAGNVVWRVALIFAGAGMAGAFLGGKVAKFLPASLLLVIFAVIMFATAFFMWRGRKATPGVPAAVAKPLPIPTILLEGLIVGLVTGLVGAGGGFLVVPALALLGGLPMQKAVGSSLVVIALKSFAGFAGYASHVTIDWELTGIVTAAAIVGSFGGAALAKKVPQEQLRKGFAVFVLVMAVFLLGKQLQAFVNKPAGTPETATEHSTEHTTATPPTPSATTTTAMTVTPMTAAMTPMTAAMTPMTAAMTPMTAAMTPMTAAMTPMTTATVTPSTPDGAPVPMVLPDPATIPTGPAGDAIRRGRLLAEQTSTLLPDHSGSDLACKNCHLAAPGHGPGTVALAGPWVGIEQRFPQYRARSGKDDTLEDRINDCFERSLNGSRLTTGDARMTDLVAYMTFLGTALPTPSKNVEGMGMPKLEVARAANTVAGHAVYDVKCLACHGAGGAGVVANGVAVFPPLSGTRTFNIAAGMARQQTAAGFIHTHMPLGQGNTLSTDEAWDVAGYVAQLDRPDFANKSRDWPKGHKPVDARY